MSIISLEDVIINYENHFRENYSHWKGIILNYNNHIIKFCNDNNYKSPNKYITSYNDFCINFLEHIKIQYEIKGEFNDDALYESLINMTTEKLTKIVDIEKVNIKSNRQILLEKINSNIYFTFNNDVIQ
jgi:hypothetical protein